MHYDIIHETVILLLSDGRYLYLDSRSSSEDNGLKTHSEFSAAIHTKEELLAKVAQYQQNSEPYVKTGQFDIMIRDRKASWYDYGRHLLRALNSAKPYSYFVNHRLVRVYSQQSVMFIEPEKKVVPFSMFNHFLLMYLYTGSKIAYKFVTEEIDRNNEQAVIDSIEQGNGLMFIIGKVDHSLIPPKPRRKP